MFRCTFHFENYTQGWSETLFRNYTFNASEATLLENYIQARLALASTTILLKSVRISNVDTKRDITVVPMPNIGRAGTWSYAGDQATEPEDSFTALLLRLSDGDNNYRSFPMLGMPDHLIQGNVIVPAEQANLNVRLNAWMNAITLASLGGKFQAAPSASGRIVEFWPKTSTNQLVCLGLEGPIPPAGSLVILGGVKPFNKLNRQWRVAATDGASETADGYIYLANSDDENTYGPVQGGTYKQPTYAISVLNAYTISRVTPRKTGVPFSTVRGRR